jgi:hypothetical protein
MNQYAGQVERLQAELDRSRPARPRPGAAGNRTCAAVLLLVVATACNLPTDTGTGGRPHRTSSSETTRGSTTTAPRAGTGLLRLPVDNRVTGLPYPDENCLVYVRDRQPLPDSGCTPGSVFDVGEAQVCTTGWSKAHRAPSSQTAKLKVIARRAYQVDGPAEFDHLVPLELGGSNDVTNLWPEPGEIPNIKDRLENRLHDLVCAGQLDLTQAQQAIASDWLAAYAKYVD